MSDFAPARPAWRPLVSQTRGCHWSWAAEAQCAAVSYEQQEEQRPVPVHWPQRKLPAGHISCFGFQEGAVCGDAQVRELFT